MTSRSSIGAIFVYGTLRRGQLRQFHWPETPSSVCAGFIKATLYDLGPYPAITFGTDIVEGELWSFSQELLPKTLEVLDTIEGYVPRRVNNLYERITVQVFSSPNCADAFPVEAYAYMMESRKLPAAAVRLLPKAIGNSKIPICRWPANDEPPAITSNRPDPFPDDIAS